MSDHTSVQDSNDPFPRPQKVIRGISFSPSHLLADLAELVQYRELLLTLSVHRLKVRYKQSLLGLSWALLQPLSLMVIYTIIFSNVAKIPSDNLPYTVFAFAGLLPWIYFQSVLANATNALVSHSNLITKVYFPREILPLTYVIAALFDLLIASTILIAMMLYYRVPLTLNVFYALPVIVVLTLFACSMALLLSASQGLVPGYWRRSALVTSNLALCQSGSLSTKCHRRASAQFAKYVYLESDGGNH